MKQVKGWQRKGRRSIYENMNKDDLISREAVIEAVDRHTREDGTLDDDISVILEEVKTAFDKEKVIEQIREKVSDCYLEHCGKYNDCLQCRADEAVKIVEKGGIE